MPVEISSPDISPEELLRTSRNALIRVNDKISFIAIPPMAEEDLRHYIQDTIAALPPAARQQLPPLTIFLVPYLDTRDSKGPVRINFEQIPIERTAPCYKVEERGRAALFFATKDEEVSEFHFNFYHQLAELLAETWGKEAAASFLNVVKDELVAKVHGEIDEKSWQMKQALQGKSAWKDSKAFRDYVKQAFIDTMTLYLHGICCDIDVETGPRQMPSRFVRRRLEILHELYPPPEGHAVFPEQLSKLRPTR